MKEEIAASIVGAVKELFGVEASVELVRPDAQFGDYSTNAALQLATKVGKNPREIAEAIKDKLLENDATKLDDVTVAGPGFLNLKLKDEALVQSLTAKPSVSLSGQTIVCEYSDPNPFKVLHAGHLYTSVVGDAIANLLENAGAKVHRVNFGGDVGLHVAKNIWAIIRNLGGELPEKLIKQAPHDFADWSSERYVEGNEAYENNETAKAEIAELNKKIYELVNAGDHDSPLAKIYWTTRAWSYDYFNWFYGLIGTKFEQYYPESETAPMGLATVKEHLGPIYEESDGAVIFDGEKYGLHTRVFINSQGLPTYETKDVGLIMKKWQDYHFDRSVVITGNDIIEYMKVVLKSIEQFEPKLSQATTHLTHGIVKLTGGTKMSSRKGNILRATDVLDAATEANQKVYGKKDETVSLAAVKYSFLKQRLGGDIIYDPNESVSLEGNSGPYLQYAHARAKSILAKAGAKNPMSQNVEFEPGERLLARKVSEYPEAVELATSELMPHHICTYLYELAQEFNRFYEKNRVIGDPREEIRLALVACYADKLKQGLSLLGIAAPDKM